MPKIDLNPDNYKSTFWGRFAESFYEEREGNEVWRQVIVRQNHDDELHTFVDVLSTNPECRFITDGSCAYKTLWHYHQNLWANNKKGSALHLFLQSLKTNGKLVLRDPAEIKGRNFNLEEYKTEEWTRSDGEVMRARSYYNIAGSDLDIPEEDKHPAPVVQSNGIEPAGVNGTAPANGIESDEAGLMLMLAEFAHGKTETEVRQGIIVRNEMPDMPPNFRPKIMNGSAIKSLMDNLALSMGEDGRYIYALA